MIDGLWLSPKPWKLILEEGSFTVNAGTRIRLGMSSGIETLESAQSLVEALTDLFDLPLEFHGTRANPQFGHITLAIAGRDDQDLLEASGELSPQGYTLTIDGNGVSIAAIDEAGLRYGVQTLIQIARSSGRIWPALNIVDRPAVLSRGIMLDISRGRVPTLETLDSLVRLFAHFKINHLQLYTEHAFDFPSAPAIGAGTGAMTPEDILRLDEICRAHHVELAANFQSLGHQGRLLKLPEFEHLAETPWRFTFATDNDEVFELFDRLYGDLLPCFTSKLLNVNADEPWDLGRGVSKAMSEQVGYGGVYLHHIRRLHELATKHGVRMAMWADVLKHYPELIPELPKDILLIDWWYEDRERYESLDALAKSGIEFWVCPSTSSWSAIYPRLDNAFSNIFDYVEQGIAAGTTGVFISEWVESHHVQPVTSSIYPFLWGAECSWSGATTSREMFDAAVGLQVFRDRSGKVVAALRRLGAAMQNDPNWMTTWNSSMALYEDPLAGKIASLAPAEVVAEARSAATAIQPLLVQIPDPIWRGDLGFLTWQIRFACDKVEATRSVQALLEEIAASGETLDTHVERLDHAIDQLSRLRSALPPMIDEFERRWLAANRRSSIQFNLDKYLALQAQFDRAIAWLTSQQGVLLRGENVDASFATYDTGGYAVMHEATYLWVKELEGIVGYDALPDDIKDYLRDVGGG